MNAGAAPPRERLPSGRTHRLVLAIVLILLCGVTAFFALPRIEDPTSSVRWAYISTHLKGADAERVESVLSEPIERAVASVENVESVRSTSRQGTSIVLLSFTWGTDMREAEVEVRKNLELFAEELLPDEASRPLTFAFDPSLAPVVFMALDGPYDGHRLRRVATEQVRPYLGRVPGVAAASGRFRSWVGCGPPVHPGPPSASWSTDYALLRPESRWVPSRWRAWWGRAAWAWCGGACT